MVEHQLEVPYGMEHRKWLVVAILFVREGEGEDLFRECARGRPRPFISVLSSAARGEARKPDGSVP